MSPEAEIAILQRLTICAKKDPTKWHPTSHGKESLCFACACRPRGAKSLCEECEARRQRLLLKYPDDRQRNLPALIVHDDERPRHTRGWKPFVYSPHNSE